MKQYRNILFFLLLFFLLSGIPLVSAQAGDKILTLDQAVSFAVANSGGIQSAKIGMVKKEIEIKQAGKAIADTRKNESTVRFSLLLNIKFPEKHAMPKEIELLTKVPSLQSELRVLKRKIENETLKAKTNCETAFYDVLLKKYSLDYEQNRLQEATAAFKKVQAEFTSGNAKKSDIEYLDKEVKAAQTAVTSAALAYETAKGKLSSICGVNVRSGYRFAADMPDITVRREQLEAMKQYALTHDYNLYSATEKRDVAQSDVDVTSSIYSSYYGWKTSDMLNYIRSCRNAGTMIDYTVFIQKYNQFLVNIDAPWAGSYVINLIFFKIYIPKEWFKRTFSGSRYLDDEAYALFVSLLALDEAESEREDVETELLEAVTDGYNGIIQSKLAYQATQGSILTAEEEYREAQKENILGTVSFTDLYDKKLSLMAQQKSLYEMQVDYAKSLSGLNQQTSGYIAYFIRKASGSALNTYADGVTSGETSGSSVPTWEAVTSAADRKFTFRIRIPEKYGVTHYELFTSDGKQIGTKTAVDQSITHLSISYADSTLLMLKLYSNKELAYLAYFDGLQYGGELILQKADTKVKGMQAGKYTITNNGMKSTLKLSSELFNFDRFTLVFEGKEIGSGSRDQGLTQLSVYLNDISHYSIRLYQGNEQMAELAVQVTDQTSGSLIYN